MSGGRRLGHEIARNLSAPFIHSLIVDEWETTNFGQVPSRLPAVRPRPPRSPKKSTLGNCEDDPHPRPAARACPPSHPNGREIKIEIIYLTQGKDFAILSSVAVSVAHLSDS